MASEIVFEGIRDITKLLDVANNNALLELAERGVSQAKAFADFNKGYQTGQTRNSIQYKLANGKEGGFNDGTGKKAVTKLDTPRKGEAIVGATTEHAVYVEFGTRKMAPQPFLRPSLAIIAGDAPDVVAKKTIAEFKLGALKHGTERVKF